MRLLDVDNDKGIELARSRTKASSLADTLGSPTRRRRRAMFSTPGPAESADIGEPAVECDLRARRLAER